MPPRQQMLELERKDLRGCGDLLEKSMKVRHVCTSRVCKVSSGVTVTLGAAAMSRKQTLSKVESLCSVIFKLLPQTRAVSRRLRV